MINMSFIYINIMPLFRDERRKAVGLSSLVPLWFGGQVELLLMTIPLWIGTVTLTTNITTKVAICWLCTYMCTWLQCKDVLFIHLGTQSKHHQDGKPLYRLFSYREQIPIPYSKYSVWSLYLHLGHFQGKCYCSKWIKDQFFLRSSKTQGVGWLAIVKSNSGK